MVALRSPRASVPRCLLWIGRRSKVRLAMIHAIVGYRWIRRNSGADVHADRMNLSVTQYRRECQAIFVTNELRDLRIHCGELFRASRKIGTAAGGSRNSLQQTIRFIKLRRSRSSMIQRGFLFSIVLRAPQLAA